MKTYPKMKDSGIEWIGKIPERWKNLKLKYAGKINPPKHEIKHLPNEYKVSFLPMEKIGEDGDINLEEEKELGEVKDGFTYFKDNDIIIAKITPCFENGKGSLCKNLHNGIGFGTTELHVLRPNSNFKSEFIFFWMRSHPFMKTGESLMYGAAGQKRVPTEFIRDFVISYPESITEQNEISTFLKIKMLKIDSEISENQKLIELLKEKRQSTINQAVTKGLDPTVPMKDSGIEWIGKIPQNWQKSSIRWVIKHIKSGLSRLLSTEDIGYPVLRSTNIVNGTLDLTDVKYWHREDTKGVNLHDYVLDDKDIILNFINSMAQIGKSCLFTKQDRDWIYTTNNFRIKTFESKLFPEYFLYFLNSTYMQKLMISISQPAVNQASFTKDDFKQLYIIYPDLDTQKKIIKFLDQETSKIDSLISKVQSQIEKLQEFRQSLISSAVTGKIDVRETVA